MFHVTPSTRLRPSPFFEATVAEGVASFTSYNHMLLPTGFGHPQEEYWRLINGASQWDVAVERQIELVGPDAGRLAQTLAPRDLAKCRPGQGKYVALCNHAGSLINDPILLKLDDHRYLVSIADSDMLFWARAIACERRLQVTVREAAISPMAVQGPKAVDVVANVFGDWVRKLKFFWFKEATVQDIPVMVARSGWSRQGGFEIYLMDESKGSELWNIVREAGRPLDIGPGCPNGIERIESGLLSWGGDTDDDTNPFEVRMGDYVDLDVPDYVIGIEALRRIRAEGPRRHQLGVVLDAKTAFKPLLRWAPIFKGRKKIGDLTNCVWSLRLERNIGFALVSTTVASGARVQVEIDGKRRAGTLVDLPFL